MSALEKVLALAVAAGKSAGSSAGKSAGTARAAAAVQPSAHQLHVEHEEHLHHLHEEHVAHEEHLHHLHVEHEEHLAHEAAQGTGVNKGTKPKKAPAGPKPKGVKPGKVKSSPVPVVKTPGPVKAASGLEAVLRLAAQEEDEASGHLHETCPWFRSVADGQPAADFRQYCQPAGSRKGLVELTPRTAEASTVPEPTVPPGGPGLFHHKGLQLPPYIQHLWHHLAPKYGKHKAYGMAVGIVKKWAAGVNPGGWDTKSGKGKRTHADVRAAAARNVAMWERDKHMGGNKRG